MLVAFNVGEYARLLEKKTDQQIVDEAMLVLRKIYGKNIPDPSAALATRWGEDPCALGAYSFVPVGESSKALDVLGEPVAGRLFFAGEATSSKHYSSAHAAYLSGLRVATQIKTIFA